MSETDQGKQHITSERSDGVLEIVFDRPEKKNAFTIAMYERVVSMLQAAATDDEVRVVLLRGAGGSFTAGNDLGDFMRKPPTSRDTPVFQLLLTLADYEKPVVVAVEGPAVGIGTTMLLHCDLVYAATDAKFKMPFVDLGLVPEGASSLLLPTMIGHARAARLLLLGEKFDGVEAERLGIASEAVSPNEVVERAQSQARSLAAKAPEALRQSKALMRGPSRGAIHAALEREGDLFMKRLTSAEAREAFTAFFEKRAPDFSNC